MFGGVYATIDPVQDRHFQCELSHTFTPEVPPAPVTVSTTDTVSPPELVMQVRVPSGETATPTGW